jgi:hypothetical protein
VSSLGNFVTGATDKYSIFDNKEENMMDDLYLVVSREGNFIIDAESKPISSLNRLL